MEQEVTGYTEEDILNIVGEWVCSPIGLDVQKLTLLVLPGREKPRYPRI